jgi:hypothetical protein
MPDPVIPAEQTTPAAADPAAANPAANPDPEKPTETTSDSASTDLGSDDEAATAAAATDLGADDPDTPAEKEEKPEVNEYHGAPEGDYEDFILPDGAPADDELKAEFIPIVKELGLSQKGAQKLVDMKAKMDGLQLQRWSNHLNELREQAKADPDIGGPKYAAAVASGKGVIAKFGSPEFRQMLNHYGVGAHPEMIKFMAKVGAAMGETPAVNNGGGTSDTKRPLHEILYKD